MLFVEQLNDNVEEQASSEMYSFVYLVLFYKHSAKDFTVKSERGPKT